MDDPGIRTQHMAEHVWRVALSGEHDLSDVAEVEQAIANVFAAGSVLIVDLTEATLIDSTVMNANPHLATSERAAQYGAGRQHGEVLMEHPLLRAEATVRAGQAAASRL